MAVVLLVLAASLVAAESALAAKSQSDDSRYSQAERAYLKLRHPSSVSTREDWLSVLASLDAVRAADPAGSKADDALFVSGRMCLEMFDRFQNSRDLYGALARMKELALAYPKSPYAQRARSEALRMEKNAKAFTSEGSPVARTAAVEADASKTIPDEGWASPAGATWTAGEEPPHPPPVVADSGARGRRRETAQILGVKPIPNPAYTRIVIEASAEAKYTVHRLPADLAGGRPPRLYLDISGARLSPGSRSSVRLGDGVREKVRMGQYDEETVRIVLDIDRISSFRTFSMSNPFRIILDVKNEEGGGTGIAQMPPVSAAGALAKAGFSMATPVGGRKTLAEVDSLPGELIPPPPRPDVAIPAKEVRKPPGVALAADPVPVPPSLPPDELVLASAPPSPSAPSREALNSALVAAGPVDPPRDSQAESGPLGADSHARGETRPKSASAIASSTDFNLAPVAEKVEEPGPKEQELGEKPGSKAGSGPDAGGGEPARPARTDDARSAAPEEADRPLEAVPPKMNLASVVGGPRLTLSQQLGLKVRRIVVDPGHGGKDPGAIGENGAEEKNVTLAIAKVLAELLRSDVGCEVILTREDDTFVELRDRMKIANSSAADLFVSVHANAHRSARVSGIETYFLNFTKDSEAMAVAARENATSNSTVSELETILTNLMRNSKINESSRLANLVHLEMIHEVRKGWPGVKDHGVKQAPFLVLVDAGMPSILLETSFITNSTEENRLEDPDYQHALAASVLKGIKRYIDMVETAGVPTAPRAVARAR